MPRTYGHLEAEQSEVVREFVAGKEVMDLGAGSLNLSAQLVGLGARKVVAVDRLLPRQAPEGVELLENLFHNVQRRCEVVFVSWLVNWPVGATRILEETETVVYLGKNTDGSSCGCLEVWRHLRGRELLRQVPSRGNTLLVYGPRQVDRLPVGEELAAWDREKSYGYDEARRIAGEYNRQDARDDSNL